VSSTSPSPPPPLPHLEVTYEAGTLLVRLTNGSETPWNQVLPEDFVFDPRVEMFRGPGIAYRALMLNLVKAKIPYTDKARAYDILPLEHATKFPPHDYQREAMDAWRANGYMGTVILPTGAGKSFLAELALAHIKRPTLIVTPTLDLVNQWHSGLTKAFGTEIGMLGGGAHEIRDITVTTYHSAHIHMDRVGNRFGLLIFDEAHHLPGASYTFAAECAIAPFRMALTATPKRADGNETKLDRLAGPIIYSKGIKSLIGTHLANYKTHQIDVDLTDEERQSYLEHRANYDNFLKANGIDMKKPEGWKEFLSQSARSRQGRQAWLSFIAQRRIALSCRSKLETLDKLLRQHAADRVIIFTNDNDTVYEISRLFLLPCITHHTNIKERKIILEKFNTGEYPAVVTGRVLNEGVNVPAANIAIILSGTGTVREHVQRLGRVLRRSGDPNKVAVLYELIASGTNEKYVSARRRDHEAYQ
jgi:superfamily II DNA or RNA helicase